LQSETLRVVKPYLVLGRRRTLLGGADLATQISYDSK
jgi:hypothetical protein